MIEGVKILELETHRDKRGFFREILRKESLDVLSDFGQISYSKVYQGVIKAWHGHKLQKQWTFVLQGLLKIKLYDNRSDSKTFKNMIERDAGDGVEPFIYSFPPGVLHGYKCVSGPSLVLYITSNTYDLAEETRFHMNDPDIGYNWTKS